MCWIKRGSWLLLATALAACGSDSVLLSPPGDAATPSVPTQPAYDPNGFYAASGVDRKAALLYPGEGSYRITLTGFVGNSTRVALSEIRVHIQLFDSSNRQIGSQIAVTKPTVLAAGQFAQYSVSFGPFASPGYVSWFRVTPYSGRGRGLVYEQVLGL